MTGTVTQTITQKIEFLQEKGYWQNPAGDLTPPQLVEYVQMMMEANELTEEDIHVHFIDDVDATIVEQVPQEAEIEETVDTSSDFTSGHIKLNMDELMTLSSDKSTTDSSYGYIEVARTITILASKYKKELYKWFCEVGYGILETSDVTLSFPGIQMSSRAVGEIMHTIMDSNKYYRVTLDWVNESGTGLYPEFVIQRLRDREDKYAITAVSVHIRLG